MYVCMYAFFFRSAASYSLGKLEAALDDANRCIALAPALHKGFLRKGLALAGLCRFDAAVEALTEARQMAPDDAAVMGALAEAEADLAAQGRGGTVSRDVVPEDARRTSQYVTQRAAAELEGEMLVQWEATQAKRKEQATKAAQAAAERLTNEQLLSEIAEAKAADQHKKDTEAAKFQAVRQGVDYDQFEQNVKGASLKPTRTKAAGSGSGPGVLLHGGSGSTVPALVAMRLCVRVCVCA